MSARRVGLSRRELERELKWILRNPPGDVNALTKALTTAVVTLIDKNNARIAESLASDDAPDVEEDF